ncbi:C39 family peptidase [Burkholderia cepacia]|uniref:C39 family peptidase n=1 Tax=Burkholderia cepacia TaxID=292 RepID=UPI001ABA3B89|nr:C39 family peptidase [Burkholderia cepacia]
MDDFTAHPRERLALLASEVDATLPRTKKSLVKAGIASLLLGSALSLWAQSTSAHAASVGGTTSADAAYRKTNDLPPRRQWEANYGYCGEVSLISAGMYYGQYVSQYDARAIASKNTDQSKKGSQLLLGVNDTYAAAQMHLNAMEWKGVGNTEHFLKWVKGKVASGYPVAIGVYKNSRSFDESSDPDAGDKQYDHIVLVTGVSSTHPLKPSAYHSNDVLTFSDNGLWSADGEPNFIYKPPFASFLANRRQANSNSHPIYSLPNDGRNYGVAITGIIDGDGQTLPIRLSTNANYEQPVMKEGSNARPPAQELMLTIMVSGLVPGLSYNLYRYDSFQSVPNAAFNAAADNADKKWEIKIESGSTFSMKEQIKSNQIVVYRAVPKTAP